MVKLSIALTKSINRRRFLILSVAGTAALAAPPNAWAQAYPTKPVRWIVGFAPGGPTDIIARMVGQRLSERLGQQFVIENRPGASSNIAAEVVAKAAPDGYALLFVVTANAVNSTLYEKLGFVFLRDIAPVAGLTRSPYVMVVNPAVPAKTIPEFIAYAKTHPGEVAAGATGSAVQAAIELFKMMANVNVLYVPYRGDAPGLMDLIGGQIQMYIGGTGSIEHIKVGRVRPLAVTTAKRIDALPDVPTIGEFLPGYEASAFYGVGTPKNTPSEIVEKLNREINAALADPKIEARLSDLGAIRLEGSATDFGRMIEDETEKWAKVVRLSGMKPD